MHIVFEICQFLLIAVMCGNITALHKRVTRLESERTTVEREADHD